MLARRGDPSPFRDRLRLVRGLAGSDDSARYVFRIEETTHKSDAEAFTTVYAEIGPEYDATTVLLKHPGYGFSNFRTKSYPVDVTFGLKDSRTLVLR